MKLTPSLEKFPQLDMWLKFNVNGTIDVYSGKVELGQKITTSIAIIASEELDVDFNRINVGKVNTDYSPEESPTVGSNSIEESGESVRQASAAAKQILLEMASKILNESTDRLILNDGEIKSQTNDNLTSYWDLIGGKKFNHKIEKLPTLKNIKEYKLIGKTNFSKGFEDIMCGTETFVQDLELPNMMHARVIRPPFYSARVKKINLDKLKSLQDIFHIEQNGSFIALASEKEEIVVKGANLLKKNIEWTKPTEVSKEDIFKQIETKESKNYLVENGIAIDKTPDLSVPKNIDGELHEATYLRPYHMHGSIGPSASMAHYDNGKYYIWSHSQGIFQLRKALSYVLGVDESFVSVTHLPGPGCYGHNGADDASLDAALIAKNIPGRPVLVKWEREDEHKWEPYGSAMIIKMKASLDQNKKINYWFHQTFSDTHTSRPRHRENFSNLLASWHLEKPFKPLPKNPMLVFHGGIHRNADPIYDFQNKTIIKTPVYDLPLRVSALRTLGSYGNIFAIETFMDELADKIGIDPFDFRIKHLSDERAIKVLKILRDKTEFKQNKTEDGIGRGIGFAKYKNVKCYAGVFIELEVDDYGNINLKRAIIVADSGQVIDKEGLKSQLEGGLIQSASWTLKEEVKFDGEEVLSQDWESYPILKFSEIPKIETILIDRPNEKPLGAGEATQGPTSAAISNAVYNAIGVRLRRIPFTAENLRSEAEKL